VVDRAVLSGGLDPWENRKAFAIATSPRRTNLMRKTKTTKNDEQTLEEIRLEQARQHIETLDCEAEERAARRQRFRTNDRIHDGILAAELSEPQRKSNEEHRREYLERKRAEFEQRAELARADEERANELSAQEQLLERIRLEDLPKDLRERLKIPVLVQERGDGTRAFKDDRRIVDDVRLASG
jgi:hypothetical protein